MFELEEQGSEALKACIKVVGVGGAGSNVINNMVECGIRSVEFIAVNTDAQALESSKALHRVQIGRNATGGLGAGAKPEVGRVSAMEDREAIKKALEGADMVFITAGMGGGTGTGAGPIVAEVAKELGALTIAIVTKPFFYEGGKRMKNAAYGIHELQSRVDSLIVIPNDRIAMVVEKGTPIMKSFGVANEVLRHSVQGISDLVLVPGLINLDFADVQTIMQQAGRAVIGMGVARGEGRAVEAARKAVLNPLLENNSIEGASGIIINITGGEDTTLEDVQEAARLIYDSASEDANIILGAVIDPSLKDELKVTVIATQFLDEAKKESVSEHKLWRNEPPIVQAPAEQVAASLARSAAPAASVRDTISAKDAANVEASEDPLDVPAFMRRPAAKAESQPMVASMARQESLPMQEVAQVQVAEEALQEVIAQEAIMAAASEEAVQEPVLEPVAVAVAASQEQWAAPAMETAAVAKGPAHQVIEDSQVSIEESPVRRAPQEEAVVYQFDKAETPKTEAPAANVRRFRPRAEPQLFGDKIEGTGSKDDILKSVRSIARQMAGHMSKHMTK